MGGPSLYIIDYMLHGEPKSFIIRAETMNNSEAWHWASCDAGVGRIPKFGREKVKRVSKPLAEKIRHYRCALAGERRASLGQGIRLTSRVPFPARRLSDRAPDSSTDPK